MSELYEKSLGKLELDQVLRLLAECAGSEGGKEACLSLRPSSDLEEVELMLNQTTAASDLCTRKGNPVFGDVTDCSASLERADRGGSLQPVELLRIAGILRCARNIKGYVAEDDKATVLDALFQALSPNKYLEDKIFGAILSEEEISDRGQRLPGAVRHPPPYAHSGGENPGQSAKGDFLPGLFQISPGADHHHPSGAVCGSREKRVQKRRSRTGA